MSKSYKNLSVLDGIFRFVCDGNTFTTVIQTRPGKCVTMPVADNPGN